MRMSVLPSAIAVTVLFWTSSCVYTDRERNKKVPILFSHYFSGHSSSRNGNVLFPFLHYTSPPPPPCRKAKLPVGKFLTSPLPRLSHRIEQRILSCSGSYIAIGVCKGGVTPPKYFMVESVNLQSVYKILSLSVKSSISW